VWYVELQKLHAQKAGGFFVDVKQFTLAPL
jgi:hypothetical protein